MPAARYDRQSLIEKLSTVFHRFGYAGTSLSHITEETGLGKGSLYNAFPKGKEAMAQAVLDDMVAWFDKEVFYPLERGEDVQEAFDRMFSALGTYFSGGARICLPGSFSLDQTRILYADTIARYFSRWHRAMAQALIRAGLREDHAARLSMETLAAVQGSLMLAHAFDETSIFQDMLDRQSARLRAMIRARQG